MENAIIVNKVKLLFEKIIEPGYIMDKYYADNFFTKINSNDPDVLYLKSLPILANLLIEVVEGSHDYHVTVKVFLIRLFAVLSESEVNFAKLIAKKGQDLSAVLNNINSPDLHTSIRVAYMEVALALLNHNSGIHWLLESKVWQEILKLCHEKRTVFIVRQTYKFVSTFLWKLKDLGDDGNVKLVLQHILQPTFEVDLIRKRSITSEEEQELCKKFEPMWQMLLAIVSNEKQIKTQNCIIHFLLREFKVTTYCYIMLDRFRSEDIWLLINKFLFWTAIGRITLFKPIMPDMVYEREDFLELAVTYFNTIHSLIQRRVPALVFDYCNACNLIWGRVWNDYAPLRNTEDGRTANVQNQLLTICIIPSLVYVTLGKNSKDDEQDKVNEYIVKIMQLTCEHTARAGYALRDLMMQLDVQQVTLQSVKRLSFLKNHLNDAQANLVFQALFYVIKEFEPFDEEGQVKATKCYEDDQETIAVMGYVLDTVLFLVKNYNINWHESLEVVCLNSVVYNILRRPNLCTKFIVTALNVISTTVKKFLPPNLSLLLDTKPGSSMHEIGKLIYLKMHDINWEVRDTALELLLVCTEISFIKFPPFQKQIMANKLINVAMTMALNDYEFYVRVSALKCVGAASKVSVLWEGLKTEYPNVLDLLISILCNNPEGIVRKEACNVLCEIYQNIKLSQETKVLLYEQLVNASLNDFHWEVQMSALKFWRVVIQSFLRDQGMLDGTFPPVTFSIESRKIVTLNEREIQKRLSKILDDLAAVGCLSILVKLLYDDTEVVVMDLALQISTELIEILDKYKVQERLTAKSDDPRIDEILKNCDENDVVESDTQPQNAEVLSDNVIEGIIKADDMNLLAHIYEEQMSIKCDKVEIKHLKLTKLATPYLFVTYLKSKNFNAAIEQKRNWNDGIRSLSSLLDDVLGIYEVQSEVNDLDCY
ncbi:uncharacterized protein LOC123695537 [Colias croceus]|uniref:uncharacterized protein LOC123695537 n=1 Tax=Colias crocea TaxID=72248 RepID=UPI001E281A66|nr:uncharacterized protein LOC123695537 [Colias croceus]